jgi:hypothetical protein
MVGWLINPELGRNMWGSGRGRLERDTGIRLQGLRETTKKLRISGIPTETRTEHCPMTTYKPYRLGQPAQPCAVETVTLNRPRKQYLNIGKEISCPDWMFRLFLLVRLGRHFEEKSFHSYREVDTVIKRLILVWGSGAGSRSRTDQHCFNFVTPSVNTPIRRGSDWKEGSNCLALLFTVLLFIISYLSWQYIYISG